MSHYEGYVSVSFQLLDRDAKEKLDAYTKAWIEKALRTAKPPRIDKNSWLSESEWTPGTTNIESELVAKGTDNSVKQYLQGIIEQGINVRFVAEVDMGDISGEDSSEIHRTYNSEKMREHKN